MPRGHFMFSLAAVRRRRVTKLHRRAWKCSITNRMTHWPIALVQKLPNRNAGSLSRTGWSIPTTRSRRGCWRIDCGITTSVRASSIRQATLATWAVGQRIRSYSTSSRSKLKENGWRIKAMHRLIMLSDTYRQSSSYRGRSCEHRWRLAVAVAIPPASALGGGSSGHDADGGRQAET